MLGKSDIIRPWKDKRLVKRLAAEYHMPESYIREMLWIEQGSPTETNEMKAFGVAMLVVLLIGFLIVGGLFLAGVGALNREATLRAGIGAHERAREASLDTMKKIITQKAQLPAAAKQDLLELLPELVAGRAGGSVFKSVQERYPEFTLSLYQDLSRSIEAERHVFLREQKELFDVKREHDALLGSAFSGSVCQMFGRRPIDVNVVSSTDAKEIVRTGVDDNADLGLTPKK